MKMLAILILMFMLAGPFDEKQCRSWVPYWKVKDNFWFGRVRKSYLNIG